MVKTNIHNLPARARTGFSIRCWFNPDVTENPQDIDDAMKLGFNWQRGPFEMMDAIGSEMMPYCCDECGSTSARSSEKWQLIL